MIEVLVVDDHAVVREGLKQVLSENQDILVAGEASCGKDVLSQVKSRNWDVVVLDISLPDISGFDLLKTLKKLRPEMPVLILTMHGEEQYALRTYKAGAAGYLTKETAPDQLVNAIRKVAAGRKYVTPSLAERLLTIIHETTGPLHERLSDREFQVFCDLSKGATLGAIAEKLGLSIKTVSTYRSRLLEKLHLSNNAELVQYAIMNKVL